MSWNAYVNTMEENGKVTQAAIFGLDGSTMGISGGLSVSEQESAALAGLFSNPSNALSSGVTLAGTKYLVINAGDKSISGVKGSGGVHLMKTNTMVVVGIYADGSGIQRGEAAQQVEQIAGYLTENGY